MESVGVATGSTMQPAWRAAYEWIVETMDSGTEYQTRRLWDMCGIPWEAATRREMSRNALTFAGYIENIRQELADVHKRVLRSRGLGFYYVVPHSEHVSQVVKDARRDVRHAIRRGLFGLDAFDASIASPSQMAQRDHAVAHLTGLDRLAKVDVDRDAERRRVRDAAKAYQRRGK